ncbi:MAG: hypothetical protein SFV17_06270 [Candidatus Obscuribacter sp.]|nr:hypothetical protein [Candidatus Melainabacteria bacterium]MDX1986273.1 hypothetical protein [Candidatus Obscuribacter sp.]
MQIRIGARQDEKGIQALTEAKYQKAAVPLSSDEQDLRNIEANYFGKDGIFLVVEENGEVQGYLGARSSDDGLVLKVKHLLLADELDDNLATELMNIALNHAYQNDFQKVEIEESVFQWLAKDHAAFAPRGLA